VTSNVGPVYGDAMTWGLAGAFAAAIAYGSATVLQAVGARRAGRGDVPDARLLWRLVHSTPYVVGLCLDGVGFALSLAALLTQPLFTVQAIVSSSLACTAVLSIVVLHARLSTAEWGALALTTTGLVMLALSASEQPPADVGAGPRTALLLVVVAIGLVALTSTRRNARTGRGRNARLQVWALGATAGLMYGAGSISARILPEPDSLLGLLVDPALWAILVAGVQGLLLYAMALQRGAVTAAMSSVVVLETTMPAVVGITLLGDRPADGRGGVAVVGFLAAVTGSLLLSRYGEAPVTDVPERGHDVAGQPA
jgi:uncharacterized membrane protein